MNTYWTFINRDIYSLRLFNGILQWCEVLLYGLTAALFSLAHRKARKVLEITDVDLKRNNGLVLVKRKVLVLAILFWLMTGVVFWAIFAIGRTTIEGLANYFSLCIMYLLIEIVLLLLIGKSDLSFRFQTRVSPDGQIMMIATDKRGRELFQVNLKGDEKTQQRRSETLKRAEAMGYQTGTTAGQW